MQALAVTTVMPVVSEDPGRFALRRGLLGHPRHERDRDGGGGRLVRSRRTESRRSTRRRRSSSRVSWSPGFAPTMEVLVAGRLVQGLGAGGQTVALYVVVARMYPAALHGRVFAAFSAAWIVPSLVGPFIAGAVAQFLHWRWVFFGIALLTVVAFVPGARSTAGDRHAHRRTGPRTGGSGAPAARRRRRHGRPDAQPVGRDPGIGWAVAAASVVVIAVCRAPVVAARHAARGEGPAECRADARHHRRLPLRRRDLRPLLLIDHFGFSPMLAGLGLTAAALAWAAFADVQGRFGDRIGNSRITLIGVALLATSTAVAALTALLGLSPAVLIAGWTLAGAGMGLMYPRLTVLTLAYSTPQNQGFNSSALSISDSIGAAVSIAMMGLAFTALQSADAGFAAVFAMAAGLALVALVPGLRLGHAHEARALTFTVWVRCEGKATLMSCLRLRPLCDRRTVRTARRSRVCSG